jgi:hypothetical protein
VIPACHNSARIVYSICVYTAWSWNLDHRHPFLSRIYAYIHKQYILAMVRKAPSLGKDDEQPEHIEAPHLRYVDWKRDPGLRKLYFWAFILCIASATTGYDAYVSCIIWGTLANSPVPC